MISGRALGGNPISPPLFEAGTRGHCCGVTDDHDAGAQRLGRALGWFSLGRGIAQISAPHAVGRLSGVDDSAQASAVVPLMGVRELVQAAGLLRGHHPRWWEWTRVAGDAIDLTLLGVTLRHRGGERRRRTTVAAAAVVGITAVDLYAASRTAGTTRSNSALRLQSSITINRGVDEVYRFWRDFENLPRFMAHLESVRVTGEKRSHWTAKGPAGSTVGWDAEIVVEMPDALITWRSLNAADVTNAGSVRFSPAPRQRCTEVRVELEYAPPGGRVGTAIAALFGESPGQQVRDDLRRFKQVIETGEVVRSEGSPGGTSVRQQLKQRPAQPAPTRR